MRVFFKRAGAVLTGAFERVWNYLGSLAAVCLFAAALGLGIYHAVVNDAEPRYYCYAGVRNPAGAEPPQGVVPLGANVSPAVPHVRLEYAEDGRLQRMKSVDAAGRLRALPGSRVAEQRLYYDASGRLVRRENRNAYGGLAEDAQGVAVREFGRDEAGRVVSTVFRNAAGERTNARFPGYAECRVSYDPQGRVLALQYLNAAGKPTRNAAGEQLVQYRYGGQGEVIRTNLVQGKPADDFAGVATEELRVYPGGSCRSWKNAAGQPVLHPEVGAASLVQERAQEDGVERRLFLLEDGTPRDSCRACAEHLARCNPQGLPEWECYGGMDGLPVNHEELGYAERLCRYGKDGRLNCEIFLDSNGLPAELAERRHTKTPIGDYVLTLHRDGSTVVQPN